MEIRQLRYFIAVADTLSFSRAADVVYLSQSALSRQIMDLEKELGMPLFQRSTRQVELTESGKAFVPMAKEFISRWEKLAPELRNKVTPNERALMLTFGVDKRALADPGKKVQTTEFLYALRRKHPGILIMMRSLDYQQIVDGLLAHTLDCALTLDRELDLRTELDSTVLGGEEMVLVFRSDNPHRDADYARVINNRGLILVDREPQGLYHIIRILSELHLEPQIRFCESLDDMTMTVETGESAAILPQSVVRKLDNPHLQTMRLPTARARLHLVLFWHRDQENPLIDEVRTGLAAVCAGNDTEEKI